MNEIYLDVVKKILNNYDPSKKEVIDKKLAQIAETQMQMTTKPSCFAGAIIYLACFETEKPVTGKQIEAFMFANDQTCSKETIMKCVYKIRNELKKVKVHENTDVKSI